MFDETPGTSSVGDSMPKPPTEDIFAGVDNATAGQPAKPAAFSSMEPSLVETALNEMPAKDNKKYLVLSGLIVLIILIGAGAWFGFKMLSSKTANDSQSIADTNNAGVADNSNTEPTNNPVSPAATIPVVAPGTTTETGNATGQANSLGSATSSVTIPNTNLGATTTEAVNQTDSDSDGLSDVLEVKWLTNPLKADTDGDGFSDGAEIKSGYNPLGAGKLTPAQLILSEEEQLNK